MTQVLRIIIMGFLLSSQFLVVFAEGENRASNKESDLFKKGMSVAKNSGLIRDQQFLALNHFGKSARWYDLLWTQGILPRPYRNKNELQGETFERDLVDSRREVFARHYELFFSNPEYPCRYPANARYMYTTLERLGELPESSKNFEEMQSSCGGVETRIFVDEVQPLNLEEPFVVDIRPSRVYAIDYFHASKGSALMSRWGHSMIRLVVCNPDREVVSSECEADVAYHVILSYRASQDDYGRDQIKGVIGGFPSKLFAMTLLDVIDEYNKEELRDLEIYRLDLTQTQKKRAIESILESYWNYIGNYAFFTNNCSHETADLLASFYTSEDLKSHRKRINASTPIQLRRRLINGDYLSSRDEKFPGDLWFVNDTLEQFSKFFGENKAKIQVSLEVGKLQGKYTESFVSEVRRLKGAKRVKSLNEFLLKTSPKERAQLYQDIFEVLQDKTRELNTNESEKKIWFIEWRSRFMALESRAMVGLALENRRKIQKLMREDATLASIRAKREETKDFFADVKVKDIRPGLPLVGEFQSILERKSSSARAILSMRAEKFDSPENQQSKDPYVIFRRKLNQIQADTDRIRHEIRDVRLMLIRMKNLS